MNARTYTHPTTVVDIAAPAAAIARAVKQDGFMPYAVWPHLMRNGNGDVDALVARWMR